MRNHIIWALSGLVLTSCISVKVPFESSSKADNVKYQAPTGPFVPFVSEIADRSWISSKTNNTLSFLSECKSHLDKVETVALDSIKAIENVKIMNRNQIQIDNQNGYEVVASGFIDQSPVKLIVTTITNGRCNFTLSYGGLEDMFSVELPIYEKFKKGFSVP